MSKIDTISTAFSVVHTQNEIKKLEDKIFNVLEEVQTIQGPIGPTGPQGLKGDKGIKGDKGDQGVKGDKGDTGLRGEKGERGETGPQGERGIDGQRGAQGERGETGRVGEIGPVGPKGEQGERGEKGDVGERGPQGPQGERGERGERGEQGFQGVAGIAGKDGAPGQPGPRGPKGNKGDLGPKGEKGDRGEKGEKGDPGTPAPDYEPRFEELVQKFNKRLSDNKEVADKNLQLQIDKINKSLTTLGGGGSYKLLDNEDVEYRRISSVEEDSILIYDPSKRKFVVTNLSQVLERLKIGVESQYNKLIDVVDNFTYIGEADPGTSTSSAKWRIKRVEELGDDYNILWADGTADFVKIWDDRLTFTYS